MRGALFFSTRRVSFTGLIPARAGSTPPPSPKSSAPRAHPRPCGEHVSNQPAMVTMPGSSPPVRGAPSCCRFSGQQGGLIPARAGSTLLHRCTPARCMAHPRPCGEHAVLISSCRISAGSSPPVRGAPQSYASANAAGGLIPARAGSTLTPRRRSRLSRAHPRPCGEHDFASFCTTDASGSSPPVRGAHLLTWGFIPYTGKIGLLWSQSLRPEYTINNCS